MANEIKRLIRIANTDIAGNKSILYGLSKIKGISLPFSGAICQVLSIKEKDEIVSLDEAKIKEIEAAIADPKSKGIPAWLFNRKNDPDSGDNLHLTGPTLKLTKEFDVRKMKKIKSYRGIRHMFGLPVRGQRTKVNFRKAGSVGVTKRKK